MSDSSLKSSRGVLGSGWDIRNGSRGEDKMVRAEKRQRLMVRCWEALSFPDEFQSAGELWEPRTLTPAEIGVKSEVWMETMALEGIAHCSWLLPAAARSLGTQRLPELLTILELKTSWSWVADWDCRHWENSSPTHNSYPDRTMNPTQLNSIFHWTSFELIRVATNNKIHYFSVF